MDSAEPLTNRQFGTSGALLADRGTRSLRQGARASFLIRCVSCQDGVVTLTRPACECAQWLVIRRHLLHRLWPLQALTPSGAGLGAAFSHAAPESRFRHGCRSKGGARQAICAPGGRPTSSSVFQWLARRYLSGNQMPDKLAALRAMACALQVAARNVHFRWFSHPKANAGTAPASPGNPYCLTLELPDLHGWRWQGRAPDHSIYRVPRHPGYREQP